MSTSKARPGGVTTDIPFAKPETPTRRLTGPSTSPARPPAGRCAGGDWDLGRRRTLPERPALPRLSIHHRVDGLFHPPRREGIILTPGAALRAKPPAGVVQTPRRHPRSRFVVYKGRRLPWVRSLPRPTTSRPCIRACPRRCARQRRLILPPSKSSSPGSGAASDHVAQVQRSLPSSARSTVRVNLSASKSSSSDRGVPTPLVGRAVESSSPFGPLSDKGGVGTPHFGIVPSRAAACRRRCPRP